MIYWIKAGDSGAVKVGYAVRDVIARVQFLQTGCPWPLILLRQEAGSRKTEAALHRHYAAKHLRAEWFLLDDSDVAVDMSVLREHPQRLPPAYKVERKVSLPKSLVRSLGGSSYVAAQIGSTRDAVRAWYRIGVPYRHFAKILDLASRKGVEGISLSTLEQTRSGREHAA